MPDLRLESGVGLPDIGLQRGVGLPEVGLQGGIRLPNLGRGPAHRLHLRLQGGGLRGGALGDHRRRFPGGFLARLNDYLRTLRGGRLDGAGHAVERLLQLRGRGLPGRAEGGGHLLRGGSSGLVNLLRAGGEALLGGLTRLDNLPSAVGHVLGGGSASLQYLLHALAASLLHARRQLAGGFRQRAAERRQQLSHRVRRLRQSVPRQAQLAGGLLVGHREGRERIQPGQHWRGRPEMLVQAVVQKFRLARQGFRGAVDRSRAVLQRRDRVFQLGSRGAEHAEQLAKLGVALSNPANERGEFPLQLGELSAEGRRLKPREEHVDRKAIHALASPPVWCR